MKTCSGKPRRAARVAALKRHAGKWVPACLMMAAVLVVSPPGTHPTPAAGDQPRACKALASEATPATGEVIRWRAAEADNGRTLQLALDHGVTIDPDGGCGWVRLAGAPRVATLRGRLAAAGAVPVAWWVDDAGARTGWRVVTRDLRVQWHAGGVAVRELRRLGLAVKDVPGHAPGWMVVSAADALAALQVLEPLRRVAGVRAADVLLARQQVRRVLPNDPLFGSQWHLKTSGAAASGTDVNIEAAWGFPNITSGVRGRGIRIGLVDDGVDTLHQDLSASIDPAYGWDWNGDDADPNPMTGDNHGTACAGLAAARGNNGLGVCGAAPEARLAALRLIAAPTTDEQEAAAMAWRNDAIQVKSHSWGPDDSGDVLEGPGPLTRAAMSQAAQTGRNGRGTILVWAAGNGGDVDDDSNYDGYANSIHTIAVGAIDSTGSAAYYTETGANIMICAPSDGNAGALGITTTDRSGTVGYNNSTSLTGGDYTNDFGGTSAAAPLVAGVAALMLEKNPLLGWRDVQEILIRSATRCQPGDTAWTINGAGLAFHPRYGAGLANATAATTLAAAWTNLPPASSIVVPQPSLALPIPENPTTGATHVFSVAAADFRVEHVTLKVDIQHTARGNLQIDLISPAGTRSRLAGVHADTNDDFNQWTFCSVRNWGEAAAGPWTLQVADLDPTGNLSGGTLVAAELVLHGSPAGPVNPPPAVSITRPLSNSSFGPGAVVAVAIDASDLKADGSPGAVAAVELLDNGVPLGVDAVAPFEFAIQPGEGTHQLVARATDDDGGVAESLPVTITLVNRAPVIDAACLNVLETSHADRALAVQALRASDPDGQPLAFAYQWQHSSDGEWFHDAAGETAATLDAAPARAGKLWRCRIRASDGELDSGFFLTEAVNVLTRPPVAVAVGAAFDYASGLVLRGAPVAVSRQAIIHEFSQGPAGATSEWIELLTLKAGSLAGFYLTQRDGERLVFSGSGVWNQIPAGTLIVIYKGTTMKDPVLPADDSDPADGRLVVSSTQAGYFLSTPNTWISLSNSGDMIALKTPDHATVHALSYGNNTSVTPNVGNVGSAMAAAFGGDTEGAALLAEAWRVAAADTGTTAGAPNNPADAGFVESLRQGVVRIPARFRAAGGAWPAGLAIDEVSGLVGGVVTAAAGDYVLEIERHNTLGEAVRQSFTLRVGEGGGFASWIADMPGVGDTTPAGDPDGDGLPNLTEYALVEDPFRFTEAPVVEDVPDGLALRYHVSKARGDVDVDAEWSGSLDGPWTTQGLWLEETGEDAVSRWMRATLPWDAGGRRGFLRLRVVGRP